MLPRALETSLPLRTRFPPCSQLSLVSSILLRQNCPFSNSKSQYIWLNLPAFAPFGHACPNRLS